MEKEKAEKKEKAKEEELENSLADARTAAIGELERYAADLCRNITRIGTRLIEGLQRQGFPRPEAVTQDSPMRAREERMEAEQFKILREEIERAAMKTRNTIIFKDDHRAIAEAASQFRPQVESLSSIRERAIGELRAAIRQQPSKNDHYEYGPD